MWSVNSQTQYKASLILLTICPMIFNYSSVQSFTHVQPQASLSVTSSQACSNSCPSSQWCRPTISSSVIPFSSCPQSLPTCWKRLKAGGERNDRGWDGGMASLTQWTWVWAGSRSWWWTGKPGALQSLGSQRIRHNWGTEMNWPKPNNYFAWSEVTIPDFPNSKT